MIPVNNKIVVSCNLDQKSKMIVGEKVLQTASNFDSNYRERSPTLVKVVEGNETVRKGDILLVHHNLLYLPSPHHLGNDLFSLPFSKVLFCKIYSNGDIQPICGNMICERIKIPSPLEMPVEYQKTYDKVYKVVNGGDTIYQKDNIVFTRTEAGYTIVYNWDGEERRIVKVDSDQVCGVLIDKK